MNDSVSDEMTQLSYRWADGERGADAAALADLAVPECTRLPLGHAH